MKLNELSAVHFTVEAWKLITLTTVKNCFTECGFSFDHVYNNDDSALKLNEDEKMTGIIHNFLKFSLTTT